MKRPSFQFYPGDWLHDAALRSCSVSARGLWMDMLCLMHQGSAYGYLKVNNKVILPSDLARIAGTTTRQAEAWITELESAGVFSRDEEGCIYSRRMIRDEEIRRLRANGGKLGGNPNLKGSGEVGDKVNLPPNLQPTPSSSSSSSSSKEEREKSASVRFPALEEVVAHASAMTPPAPKDFAEAWWNELEGAGWIDRSQRPVHPARWKNFFRSSWLNAQHKRQERQARGQTNAKRSNGTDHDAISRFGF